MHKKNIHHFIRSLLFIVAALLGAAPFAGAQITNWVAYNDHRPTTTPVVNGWHITATNVTGYNMGAPVDPAAHTLTNFLNGSPLTATVSFTPTGTPDDFGGVGRPIPTNTPMAELFYGVCDLSNDGLVGVRSLTATPPNAAESYVTVTFGGLDPAKRYVFRGAGVRNGSYLTRWSVAAISANDSVDAHINGTGSSRVLTGANFPASGLALGEAAWNSGANAEGAVVGWDFISPFPDGTFSITVKQYTGAVPGGGTANGSYGYAFGAILLAEVEAVAPTITANPAATTTVEQNRPISLSVAATGTPLLYQWYKEGVGAIAGATFPTLLIPQAALTDSGNYYAVVYNPLASETSTVAQVTVFADTEGPVVESIFSFPTVDAGGVATLDQIIIEFNEPVTPASVSAPGSYTLSSGGNPVSVIVTNQRSVVLVLGTPLTADTDYSVTLSGATDILGNVAGSSSAPFHSWVSGEGNGLLFEAFNVEGNSVEVFSLTDSPNYPDNPFTRATIGVFDSRAAFPDDTHNEYGGRIRGVFIPPVSGNWSFFFRTRQRGVVYLNPNGLDPAGKVEILRESTGNTPLNWDRFTSPPQPLRAGRAYYIESLYKEGDGLADFVKVAARLAGTGFPTPVDTPDIQVDTNSIAGAFIGHPLAPRDLGGPLTLVQDLHDITAEENHPVTFAPQVGNPSGLPLFYQWFRDGVEIMGANGPNYTFQATSADSGATFRVQVGKIGSTTNSQTATLSVVPDTNGPVLLSVKADDTFRKLTLTWDERIDEGAAVETGNYYILDSMNNQVFVNGLVYNGTSVVLNVTAMLPGTLYSVEVDYQQDPFGNYTKPVGTPVNDANGVVASLRTYVFTPGLTRFQAYQNLPTGGTIADFVASPAYPDRATFSFYTNVLYWPQSAPDIDQYAMRFTGIFIAPETGTYLFDPANDDEVRLRIYPGPDATGVPAELTGTAVSGLTGGPTLDVDMVAGSRYFYELIVRELTGGDLAGLAVTLPSATISSPIAAQYLEAAIDPGASTPSAPVLTARRSGGNLVITWPESSTGFTLETAATLPSAIWDPVGSSVVNGENTAIIPIPASGHAFYRLRQ